MVKIVVKKEGATQTCGKCETELICRLKDYGGNFAPTLQWQNFDGSPHFKTSDGKTYACNVPNPEDTVQTRISSETPPEIPFATAPGTPPPTSINLSIINTLDEIKLTLQRVDEMIQAIFRFTVDEQLSKKK